MAVERVPQELRTVHAKPIRPLLGFYRFVVCDPKAEHRHTTSLSRITAPRTDSPRPPTAQSVPSAPIAILLSKGEVSDQRPQTDYEAFVSHWLVPRAAVSLRGSRRRACRRSGDRDAGSRPPSVAICAIRRTVPRAGAAVGRRGS